MAVHFEVYDKHLPDCQTNIARLAIFVKQSAPNRYVRGGCVPRVVKLVKSGHDKIPIACTLMSCPR